MKFLNIASAALLVAGAATASSSHDPVDNLLVSRNHHAVSEEKRAALAEQYALEHPGDVERAIGRRGAQDRVLSAKRHQNSRKHKKCRNKTHKAAAAKHNSQKATSGQHKDQSKSNEHGHANKSKSNEHGHSTKSKSHATSTESAKHSKSTSSSHGHGHSSGGGSGKGLFGMTFGGACSNPDANDERPNGSVEFLTCGISKHNTQSKWNPPNVKMSDVKMISADQAAQADVFKPCAKYKSTFEQVANDVGIPAVLLMSFALQESTCNAGLTGANGEIGISQITPDKCGGAPGGNCHDVYFNLSTAAKYFKNTLDGQCNGNMLCAVGQYNGWQAGKMTYASATNQQYGCMSQVSFRMGRYSDDNSTNTVFPSKNNLDYTDQLLNGFCQGKDGYSGKFKTFGNIAHC